MQKSAKLIWGGRFQLYFYFVFLRVVAQCWDLLCPSGFIAESVQQKARPAFAGLALKLFFSYERGKITYLN